MSKTLSNKITQSIIDSSKLSSILKSDCNKENTHNLLKSLYKSLLLLESDTIIDRSEEIDYVQETIFNTLKLVKKL